MIKKVLNRVTTIFTLCMVYFTLNYSVVSASTSTDVTGVGDSTGLTGLFKTAAFSGSWEVFSKMNWLGAALQFVISACCLLGLMSKAYSIIITYLYLSNKPMFNYVHEVQQVGKGQKFFGLPGMYKDIFNGNKGQGANALISIVVTLIPDIKNYSMYNDDYRPDNLSDDDTILTFTMKESFSTIFTIFFFSIGFNGVLFRAYGNVSDAMGTAAEAFVDVNLSKYVDRAINSGANYSFGYNLDGTRLGKLKQNIAKDINSQILRNTVQLTTSDKTTLGRNIASQMDSNMNKDLTGFTTKMSKWGVDFKGTDADVKNLYSQVYIDNNKSVGGEAFSIPVDNLGIKLTNADSSGMYVHVFVLRKANADETNYFEVTEDKSSSSGSNTPTNTTKVK